MTCIKWLKNISDFKKQDSKIKTKNEEQNWNNFFGGKKRELLIITFKLFKLSIPKFQNMQKIL